MVFRTRSGLEVPAVTARQMREIDRIAVEDFGLGILQMMENAGRTLALNAVEMLGSAQDERTRAAWIAKGTGRDVEVTILAGSGGNGGGGLCCARHLHNRGFRVSLLLSKEREALRGAAASQLRTLLEAGVEPIRSSRAPEMLRRAQLVVDALIGYSLRGAPRGLLAELIECCNEEAARVLSLDLPSGLDATSGEAPGAVIHPERTLTLALPKVGLRDVPGELCLADIGIPSRVYRALDVSFEWPLADRYWMQLVVGRARSRSPGDEQPLS